MTRAPRWAAAAVVAAAWVGACTDVGTAPDAIVAIAFDSLPYPSVVAGDTMRDSAGRAAPLTAVAYNTSGSVIANPSIRYLSLDTGVDIGPQGYLVATTRTGGTVRVVAAAATLQSLTRTVVVTHPPTLLAASGATDSTLKYDSPDRPTNVGPPMTVKLTRDSAGVSVGVPGFLVSWQATFHGTVVAKADTTASFWTDASARVASAVDTTAADGTAARSLRIRTNTLPATDSFFVYASVKYRGAAVAGSPVKFVIHFRPKAAR